MGWQAEIGRATMGLVKLLYLNPYDQKREARKLRRARLAWAVTLFLIIPSGLLILLDRPRHILWIVVFVILTILVSWIPMVTNCGRCGTSFFFDERVETWGFTPRVNLWRRPRDQCGGCKLDRANASWTKSELSSDR